MYFNNDNNNNNNNSNDNVTHICISNGMMMRFLKRMQGGDLIKPYKDWAFFRACKSRRMISTPLVKFDPENLETYIMFYRMCNFENPAL